MRGLFYERGKLKVTNWTKIFWHFHFTQCRCVAWLTRKKTPADLWKMANLALWLQLYIKMLIFKLPETRGPPARAPGSQTNTRSSFVHFCLTNLDVFHLDGWRALISWYHQEKQPKEECDITLGCFAKGHLKTTPSKECYERIKTGMIFPTG